MQSDPVLGGVDSFPGELLPELDALIAESFPEGDDVVVELPRISSP